MECCEPGAIRDEEIIAYLAGEKVRPAVREHMERCESCATRFAAYQRLEHVLTSKLYRWDCPSNQELGEYILGLLSSEEEARLKVHLSSCVLCVTELEALSTFLAQDDPLIKPVVVPATTGNHHTVSEQPPLLERLLEPVHQGLRRIIADLVPAPVQPMYSLRGAVSPWPKRYTAEDVSISLQLERSTEREATARLVGFVSRKGATLQALQGTPVVLLPLNSSGPYTQHIDDLGNFIFSDLTPDTYRLELRLSDSYVVIEEIAVALDEDTLA